MRPPITVGVLVAVLALLAGAKGCQPETPASSPTPAPQVDAAPPPPSPLPKRVPNGSLEPYQFSYWVKVRAPGGALILGKRVQMSVSTIQADGDPGHIVDPKTGKLRPTPWVYDTVTPYRSDNDFFPGIVALEATATYLCAKGEYLEVFAVHDGVEILGTRMESPCVAGPGGHGVAVASVYVALPS